MLIQLLLSLLQFRVLGGACPKECWKVLGQFGQLGRFFLREIEGSGRQYERGKG